VRRGSGPPLDRPAEDVLERTCERVCQCAGGGVGVWRVIARRPLDASRQRRSCGISGRLTGAFHRHAISRRWHEVTGLCCGPSIGGTFTDIALHGTGPAARICVAGGRPERAGGPVGGVHDGGRLALEDAGRKGGLQRVLPRHHGCDQHDPEGKGRSGGVGSPPPGLAMCWRIGRQAIPRRANLYS